MLLIGQPNARSRSIDRPGYPSSLRCTGRGTTIRLESPRSWICKLRKGASPLLPACVFLATRRLFDGESVRA